MFFSLFKKEPVAFNSGYLPEENGHQVFFHEFGNPKGTPVLGFHGGPGYYSNRGHTKYFDLKKQRVILFDQRGCGKSLPAGETKNNTTADLLHDANRLLAHLQIDKVVIYGSSWGSTLAFLFAQAQPERVEKLIVTKMFLARQRDIEGLPARVEQFYPEFFGNIRDAVPAGLTMRQYYASLAASAKHEDVLKSYYLYGRCENLLDDMDPEFPVGEPDEQKLNAWRIYMHYDALNYGVTENQILENIHKIAHIPTLIVHNRLDMICPIEQAHLVFEKLDHASLVIVPNFGHGSDMLRDTVMEEVAEFLA